MTIMPLLGLVEFKEVTVSETIEKIILDLLSAECKANDWLMRKSLVLAINTLGEITQPETIRWVVLMLRDVAARADCKGEYDVADSLRKVAEALQCQL